VQQERCDGYRDALAAAGIEVDPTLIIDVLPNRDGGDSAIGQLLGMHEPPTAVMCFNDVVGFGVCLGLKKRGIEPGRDVAVVGFDDVAEARHVVPALTTVAVDCFGLGERAAQLVLRMIERGTPSSENEVGSVQLIVRESCGAKLKENRRATK
jgi:LacI family transcriptional regulator